MIEIINKNSFAKRLNNLKHDHESIRAYALRCDISPKSMENYLKGVGGITLDNLIKIADANNVTVGWLANGEEPRHPGTIYDLEQARLSLTIKEEEINQILDTENVNLRNLMGWLLEQYGGDSAQQMFLTIELSKLFPTLEKYLASKNENPVKKEKEKSIEPLPGLPKMSEKAYAIMEALTSASDDVIDDIEKIIDEKVLKRKKTNVD